jgi:AbrB family looped-hinge helix DNA binding protein
MTDTIDHMTHSVGTKGQVVIPKHIRDELNIRPGQEIVFETRGDEIVLRKSTGGSLKGRFANRGLTEALLETRREDRELDDRRS